MQKEVGPSTQGSVCHRHEVGSTSQQNLTNWPRFGDRSWLLHSKPLGASITAHCVRSQYYFVLKGRVLRSEVIAGQGDAWSSAVLRHRSSHCACTSPAALHMLHVPTDTVAQAQLKMHTQH